MSNSQPHEQPAAEDVPIVIVVDDDSSMREALANLLRSAGHVTQCHASAKAFLAAPLPEGPACIVLDVRMPEQSGLELQRELNRLPRCPPIIFVTGHGDIPMAVAAMRAGAIEFLSKPFREHDLLEAIGRGIRMDREERACQADLQLALERFHSLTPREREVMDHVVRGQPSKIIAHELGLSVISIKVYRAQMMRKMQAASLPELTRMAEQINGHLLGTGPQS